MFRRLLMGVVGGVSMASSVSVTSAAEAPSLDAALDPSKDVDPVRCVIIGGGYSGGKVAYQLDSIFNVTLIDTKNYVEITSDIIPIISSKWSEKNEEACRKLQILHRYYLKRANVLTGHANGATDKEVILSDGRRVPYDLLIVATGEQKSFPFETTQKSIGGRISELKHFNEFLNTQDKVAIIGGGPMGASLAAQLSEDRPEMEVHLFHSTDVLLPQSPEVVSEHTMNHLRGKKNIVMHLCDEVTKIEGLGSVTPPPQPKRWWQFTSAHALSTPPEFTSFTLHTDHLDYDPMPMQSVVSQIYFGKLREKPTRRVVGKEVFSGFGYVFNVGGDTPRKMSENLGILSKHVGSDGHIKVSTLMQIFGSPEVFAVGRCNNLPWCRGLGSSDLQARSLFRMFNGIVNSSVPKVLSSNDGLHLDRLTVPRLLIRLGNSDACGSTPWGGALTGINALREFLQDRGHLQREFSTPIFYKQQDVTRVSTRIKEWKSNEITDITDFSFAE